MCLAIVLKKYYILPFVPRGRGNVIRYYQYHLYICAYLSVRSSD